MQARGYAFSGFAMGPESGELVLLLHGFPQFADAWLPVLRLLASAGFRAVAVDQRGYVRGARPEKTEAYAVQELVADVLAVADALGAERFHLAGHDWGGLVAWKLAAEHPGRLRSLAVLSTPHPDAFLRAIQSDPDQRRRSRYIALFRLPGHVAENALLAFDAKLLRAAYEGKVPAAEVDANVRRLSEPHALTGALNWYRALDLEMHTGGITVPTLYVWSTNDVALGETAAIGTAAYVDGPYRFERLEKLSHWLLEEAPGQVAELLLEHLRANLDRS